ncbi:MAG: GNAT family N-acetyltransferase [Parvibaculaceae bacterium]|nr:GNAT family N-acetyltransferase [Parvibaculaceae bacterium]
MEFLRTERLLLRPFRACDAGDVARHIGEWDVARMLSRVPYPYPLAEAKRWIASHPQAPVRDVDFPFAIEADGALAGCAGYHPGGEGMVEIGYWLARPAWGKGFATEAGRALVGFLFDRFGLEALAANHFEDNPASGRVLTKLGFRYTGVNMSPCRARGYEVPCLTMRLQRKDAGALFRPV